MKSTYSSSIVKCDGTKIHAASNEYEIAEDVTKEYLHYGNKLLFRFEVNMFRQLSQENKGLLKLFRSINGSFNDFSIQAVGGTIRVMKNVLAVKWTYFEKMMEAKGVEYTRNIWIVEDVTIKIMRDIVGYVYCDAITLENKKHTIKLVEVGHRYLLEDLLILCTKYLVAEITSSNVLSLLVLSDLYNLTLLKDKCFTVVAQLVSGKAMKDLNGYVKYIKYSNHVRLTEACFEDAIRKLNPNKRKLTESSLD
ncbi:TD and POZ domain-containing protein 4 [Halotydeus destructor]|nr:TD and POZ domain-containing protein 4 [Halotydeus destructor]